LTTCIHHSELYFTDHWHTQTSVLSLLQSPLAVSWQRICNTGTTIVSLNYTLQISHINSSLHSQTFSWVLLQVTLFFTTSCTELPLSWQLNSVTHQPGISREFIQLNCQVKVKVMLRPTVSRPVWLGTKHPFGAYDQILIIVLTVAGLLIWGALSDERTGLPLQLLLVRASAVIFGSESRRTRGHTLLSQIRDFPFLRLLRLAGSRWRYSTPPPRGLLNCQSWVLAIYSLGPNSTENTASTNSSLVDMGVFLAIARILLSVYQPFPSNPCSFSRSLHGNGTTHCNIKV
jgi:hypothetical protein